MRDAKTIAAGQIDPFLYSDLERILSIYLYNVDFNSISSVKKTLPNEWVWRVKNYLEEKGIIGDDVSEDVDENDEDIEEGDMDGVDD